MVKKISVSDLTPERLIFLENCLLNNIEVVY